MLQNDFILLRAVEPTDLETIYDWENDTQIWHVSQTITPFSKYAIWDYIQQTLNKTVFELKQVRLMIELKENQTLLGSIDLFDIDFLNKRAGIGILIHQKEHQNRGFASQSLQIILTYALKTLNLHQLYASTTPNNEPSKQLFLKNGFEIIGLRKDWFMIENQFHDELLMQKILISK